MVERIHELLICRDFRTLVKICMTNCEVHYIVEALKLIDDKEVEQIYSEYLNFLEQGMLIYISDEVNTLSSSAIDVKVLLADITKRTIATMIKNRVNNKKN